MEHKSQSFRKRLGFAMNGVGAAFRREQSLKIQLCATVMVVFFCLVTNCPAIWTALFIICCVIVLTLELVNTALEAILDHIHPHHALEIGFAKDCLAGAVLLASAGSLIVFCIYLGQLIPTVAPSIIDSVAR